MTGDASAEIVRLAADAFNSRDLAAMEALVCEDLEFYPARSQLEKSVYTGVEGLERFPDEVGRRPRSPRLAHPPERPQARIRSHLLRRGRRPAAAGADPAAEG